MSALEARGMLDNTVVIFSSDHGEMAGDHNQRGKGNFYEGSCHVPMVVRQPGAAQAGTVRRDLVALTDVTATLLALGGHQVPDYMDARPLPGLGLEGESAHQHLVGFLQGAWMAFDGRFKLCKYSSGFQALFDLESDPQEQDNLVDAAEHQTDYRRLDTLLCQEIMRSTQASNADNEVFIPQQEALWASQEFGRSGWQRTYPKSLED
jgi:arylsulfatase A-like enzyme